MQEEVDRLTHTASDDRLKHIASAMAGGGPASGQGAVNRGGVEGGVTITSESYFMRKGREGDGARDRGGAGADGGGDGGRGAKKRKSILENLNQAEHEARSNRCRRKV